MQARTKVLCVVAAFAALLLCASAQAEIIIIKPVSATASSNWYNGDDSMAPWHLIEPIQNAGVDKIADTAEESISGHTVDPLVPATWFIKDAGGEGWLMDDASKNVVNQQWILLDLGSAKDLSKIDLWQFPGGATRCMKDLEIWKSDASHNDVGGAPLLTITNFPQVSGVPVSCSQYDFDVTGVQYIKIKVLSNYGDAYVGLGFVRFEGKVPEPGTLALLASGLIGLMAYAWRKRK